MTAILAFHTQAPGLGTYDDPVMKEFVERIPSVFESAYKTDGHLARVAGPNGDEYLEGPASNDLVNLPDSWGFSPTDIAAFYKDHPSVPATLSFWKSLESVAAFSYRGLHGEALKMRNEWFAPTEYPVLVAWWINEGETLPTWKEATRKLLLLHENGPTPEAFNFKSSFDASGTPAKLDRAEMTRLAESVS